MSLDTGSLDTGNTEIRVLAISGSLRRASFNSGLLRAAQVLAPAGMEVLIHDIRSIPFYDGDLEAGATQSRLLPSSRPYVIPMPCCWPRQSTTGAPQGC